MAIVRVNTRGAFNTNVNPSFPATAGNLLVAVVRSSVSATGVTDTAGNTYTKIIDDLTQPITKFTMWAAPNCLGHATNVVTVAVGGSSIAVAVVQYSGIATAGALNTTTFKVGATSGATITTPTFSTTTPDALILSFCQVNQLLNTWTPNGGATKFLDTETSGVVMGMELIVTAIQTNTTASVTCSNNTDLILLTAAFTATGGGGGGGVGGSFAFVG